MASDDFNRADGSLGANWTDSMNALAISGNEATGTAASDQSVSWWSGDSFPDDQFSQFTCRSGSGNVYWGAVVRHQPGSASFYVFYVNPFGDEKTIYRWAAGSPTLLRQEFTGSPVVSGDVIHLEAIGNVLTGYINGVQIIQTTDSTYTSGAPGINVFDVPTLDNWSGGSLSSFSPAWAVCANVLIRP